MCVHEYKHKEFATAGFVLLARDNIDFIKVIVTSACYIYKLIRQFTYMRLILLKA